MQKPASFNLEAVKAQILKLSRRARESNGSRELTSTRKENAMREGKAVARRALPQAVLSLSVATVL
jgi:hypothetical protein